MTDPLVLASSSPTRRKLLSDAGLNFEVEVSGLEETSRPLSTAELVLELAREKAQIVAERREIGFVLGCDSLLDLEGISHGKPRSPTDAVACWHMLRSRRATLFTGHVLIDIRQQREASEVVGTIVQFGSPSDAEVEAYVASGEPLDKAGAFTLEGRSSPFIERIEGDAANVRGLSLAALGRLLGKHGHSITDFWQPTDAAV